MYRNIKEETEAACARMKADVETKTRSKQKHRPRGTPPKAELAGSVLAAEFATEEITVGWRQVRE